MMTRRGWWIAGCLLAAGALVIVQVWALREAALAWRQVAHGAGGDARVTANWWRATGVLLPFALAALGLWLLHASGRRWLRRVASAAFVALLALVSPALLIAWMRGPIRLDSVTLPTGEHLVLALEPIPTDSVYSLYRTRWGSPWWREAGHLDYSEDGRFIGDERLTLSPDRHWLLVQRAGL